MNYDIHKNRKNYVLSEGPGGAIAPIPSPKTTTVVGGRIRAKPSMSPEKCTKSIQTPSTEGYWCRDTCPRGRIIVFGKTVYSLDESRVR